MLVSVTKSLESSGAMHIREWCGYVETLGPARGEDLIGTGQVRR